ncbi:MAG: glycosyltransferase [Bacteroidia bacterium]|nr:glycosyltransferase [Bacteroidia bacterium]
MNTLISVIIPAHNEGKTICRTVDSLLRQDCSCFEIIVVDDGSDDNTGKKLADYYKLCQTEPVLIQSSLQHKPIVKIWNGICNNVKIYERLAK